MATSPSSSSYAPHDGVSFIDPAALLNCCVRLGEGDEQFLTSHFKVLRDRDQAYYAEYESVPSCYIVERVVHLESGNVVLGIGRGMYFNEACEAATNEAMRDGELQMRF